MKVPFVDLFPQHEEVRGAIDSVIKRAIDQSSFIGGTLLTDFESHFADYCGTAHAVGVSDGTHALVFALKAVGVTAGDLVVTVSHTFFATTEAVVQCNADPVFIEIDEETYTMSTSALEQWLSEMCIVDRGGVCRHRESGRRVSAVLPVHLYGQPADMEPILGLAKRYSLKVVEDACQAHGAWYTFTDGRRVRAGNLGDAGCFSFYPGKNLGAMGEGGAVVTNEADVAAKISMLREHGQSEKYIHKVPDGVNGRLDAIQAGILDVKLSRLDGWNSRRRQIAERYTQKLANMSGVIVPCAPENREHVYHLYVILVENRDMVRDQLQDLGVSTGLHYPVPVHLQEAAVNWGYVRGDLPVTEKVANTLLSLPMFPHMTDDQVDYVVDSLRSVMNQM